MDLDDTMVALADETRRSILQRLAAGDARVTEIAAPYAISLNSVSKHIRILERAGLVRRRIVGRDHFLSLDPAPMDGVAAWIQRERAAWTARLDRLEAVLRAEDAIEAAKRTSRQSAKPRRKP
jgi:DNA-binding transcriptional ArsR family regulator